MRARSWRHGADAAAREPRLAEALAAILERGVEVNAAAADGTTALHLAAAAGFRESCRVLLQNGADRGQKNAAGATAIDAAKGGGHDQLAAFIDGWTPAALGENTRATDPEL